MNCVSCQENTDSISLVSADHHGASVFCTNLCFIQRALSRGATRNPQDTGGKQQQQTCRHEVTRLSPGSSPFEPPPIRQKIQKKMISLNISNPHTYQEENILPQRQQLPSIHRASQSTAALSRTDKHFTSPQLLCTLCTV